MRFTGEKFIHGFHNSTSVPKTSEDMQSHRKNQKITKKSKNHIKKVKKYKKSQKVTNINVSTF